MIKKRIKHPKIKASLVIPFLALLFITSLVTVAFYQIRVANANQFRLLRDTYRLKTMLELTTQNLDSYLEVKDNEMIFPTRMDFSSGNVEIVDIFTKEVLLQKDALPVIIHKLTLKLLLSTTKNNCKQEKACNKNSGFF